MKKYTHITLVGNVSIDYDYKWCNKLGDIVAGGEINKPLNTKFSITNNELELQRMINNINLKNSIILTPLTLYKKYLFFIPTQEVCPETELYSTLSAFV